MYKRQLHSRYPEKEPFAEMLVDLCEYVHPDFSIIDAIDAMEGDGPTGGQKRFVGALVGSESPYEADMVGAKLIDMNPEEILVLKNAQERGLCAGKLSEIEVLGDDFENIVVHDFKRARSSSIDFTTRVPKFMQPLAKRILTPYPKINTAQMCIRDSNMAEFLYFVNDCLKRGIPTAILDNAYTNGGELQLLRVLNKQGVLMKLAGYAGWNTSSNSMGTVLAMIVNNMYQNNTEAKQNFLVERFIEDFGYGAVVRSYVTEHILPQWGMTYFWCEEQRGKAANAVLEELRKFVKTEMTSVADKVTVEDIFLPWSRMFEIGLKATYKAD